MPIATPPSSRAVSAIKVCAATYLLISTAIIVFGRNVPSIWQGMAGLIAALEGYYGAESLNPKRVLFFLAALVPCVAVSCTLGILAVTGNPVLVFCGSDSKIEIVRGNSTTSQNTAENTNRFDSCSTSFKLYGFVELIGGAAVGLIAIVVVAASYRPLCRESEALDEKQDALEASSLKANVAGGVA